MEKILKPFVVFITYVVLYGLTISAASAIVSLVLWANYLSVVTSVYPHLAFIAFYAWHKNDKGGQASE